MISLKICNNLNVDMVYCLYLEEYELRKKIALEEFKKMNLNVKMFKGIYLKDKPHIGCKLSHINIIKDAKLNNYKNILICEDDVDFLGTFPINVNIPEDFGMFYLGYFDYDNLSVKDNNLDLNKDSNFSLMRLFYSRSTFCYILNEKTYDSILANENTLDGTYAFIDMFYGGVIQNKFPSYGIYPLFANVKNIISTISNIEDNNISNLITEKAKSSYEKDVIINFYKMLNIKKPFHYNGICYNNFINL